MARRDIGTGSSLQQGTDAGLDRLRDRLEESSAIAEIAARHPAPPDR
jgi:hypothetical protein